MKKAMLTLGLVGVLLMVLASAGAAEEFPLRSKYPAVVPVDIAKLAEDPGNYLIVDVRSAIEYGVVHINNAVNLPVAQGGFVTELAKLREKGGSQPIAFYCNGHTCAKSYKASVKAMDAGFENVYCFDAGIYEWVKNYPEMATLMGQTPAPTEKLISKAGFEGKKVTFGEFRERAAEPDAMIIDIREPFQRAQNPDLPQNKLLALSGVRNIPTDRLVELLREKKFQNRRLLITDAVGKQVRWLQYHLEDNGYTNYAFLDRGVLGASEAGGVR